MHVVRGATGTTIVRWDGAGYSAANSVTASRAVADEIWSFVIANYVIDPPDSWVYNGLAAYSSAWPDNGQLGLD